MPRRKVTRDMLIMEEVVHMLKKNYIDVNNTLVYLDDSIRKTILDEYADFILLLDRKDWQEALKRI